jgi:hypothetical protein
MKFENYHCLLETMYHRVQHPSDTEIDQGWMPGQFLMEQGGSDDNW